MKRAWWIVIGLSVLVVAGVGLAMGKIPGLPGQGGTTVSARFSSAVGLYAGSDVRILGVSVGRVKAVEPDREGVKVTLELDHGRKAAADTGAAIVSPTMVSDRYVQLTSPYTGGRALAAGATITETQVPVEIDELYSSLEDITTQLGPDGANKNGAMSRLLTVAAENLGGQGKKLNTMINEFGKATGTLAGAEDDFFATIGNLDSFNTMLVAHDQGVADANRQLASVSKYLAEDSDDLGRAIANLGDALGVLDDFIKDNRGNLTTSVKQLEGPTRTLVKQKKSLEEAVRTIPLALQNFLSAYNPATNTVDGRANLNELTVWADGGNAARTSSQAPPVLLPGLDTAKSAPKTSLKKVAP